MRGVAKVVAVIASNSPGHVSDCRHILGKIGPFEALDLHRAHLRVTGAALNIFADVTLCARSSCLAVMSNVLVVGGRATFLLVCVRW